MVSFLRQLGSEIGADPPEARLALDVKTTGLAINAMAFEGTRAVARASEPAAEAERWKNAVTALMFDGIRA